MCGCGSESRQSVRCRIRLSGAPLRSISLVLEIPSNPPEYLPRQVLLCRSREKKRGARRIIGAGLVHLICFVLSQYLIPNLKRVEDLSDRSGHVHNQHLLSGFHVPPLVGVLRTIAQSIFLSIPLDLHGVRFFLLVLQ